MQDRQEKKWHLSVRLTPQGRLPLKSTNWWKEKLQTRIRKTCKCAHTVNWLTFARDNAGKQEHLAAQSCQAESGPSKHNGNVQRFAPETEESAATKGYGDNCFIYIFRWRRIWLEWTIIRINEKRKSRSCPQMTWFAVILPGTLEYPIATVV